MKILHNRIPKIRKIALLVLTALAFLGCKNDTGTVEKLNKVKENCSNSFKKKMMQKVEKSAITLDRLRLKGSLCGDGPYDPFATYDRYTKYEYQLWLPSVITLILRAYLYYYKDSYLKGFTIEDYLKPEVINALKNGTDDVWNMIDSKDKSTTDIDNVIKNAVGEKGSAYIPVSKMITEKATNPESDAYKVLKAALDANNLTDTAKWLGGKNNKTIATMHWQCDEVVPYENFKSLKSNLTVKEKDWNASEKSTIQTIDKFLRGFGISDALWGVSDLFNNEPKVSNGSHIAAGTLFFAGNIFYRVDYKKLNE